MGGGCTGVDFPYPSAVRIGGATMGNARPADTDNRENCDTVQFSSSKQEMVPSPRELFQNRKAGSRSHRYSFSNKTGPPMPPMIKLHTIIGSRCIAFRKAAPTLIPNPMEEFQVEAICVRTHTVWQAYPNL